jgi:site-specific DNA-methyltransferase (adenine-specific)
MLYKKTDDYTIFNYDCLEVMDQLDANSVDAIITDPPYHLVANESSTKGFLEQEWDAGDIAFRKETWQKAMRVLKPGGYLIAFGHSKKFHRMVTAIEDAGFEIRDTLMWLYGTGFPKSHDVGLDVDRLLGNESTIIGEVQAGKTSSAFQRKETTAGDYQIKRANNEWAGWGSALKPNYEPIVMARKPFTGTLANNVLTYGTGAINIDACRIEGEPIQVNVGYTDQKQSEGWGTKKPIVELQNKGRYPGNVMHDGSDEVLDMLPKREYGRFFYSPKASKKDKNDAGKNNHPTVKPVGLMRYLVRLVTPPNGVVLDPFMGSGSTGKAIFLENKENSLNSKFIGIDLDPSYCRTAMWRLELASKTNLKK